MVLFLLRVTTFRVGAGGPALPRHLYSGCENCVLPGVSHPDRSILPETFDMQGIGARSSVYTPLRLAVDNNPIAPTLTVGRRRPVDVYRERAAFAPGRPVSQPPLLPGRRILPQVRPAADPRARSPRPRRRRPANASTAPGTAGADFFRLGTGIHLPRRLLHYVCGGLERKNPASRFFT